MQGSRIDATLRAEARARRRAPDPARHRLWQGLKRLNRLAGCHFRRQAPVGWAILDFADFGRRLAIEIEGGREGGTGREGDAGHAALGDAAARRAWLEARGFRVLRLARDRVLGEPAAVLAEIARAAGVAPPPSPSPARGEGRTNAAAGASPPPCGEGSGVGGGAAGPAGCHEDTHPAAPPAGARPQNGDEP